MSDSIHLRTTSIVACALRVAFFLLIVGAGALHADSITVGGACGATIQACINSADSGDTVQIPAGEYVESLTLNKAVNLVGANRTTTIVRAPAGQRVMLVTGASVNNSVIITGFTLTGGYEMRGAGDEYTGTARPRLESLIMRDNQTVFGTGAGLYAAAGNPLRLTNVHFI